MFLSYLLKNFKHILNHFRQPLFNTFPPAINFIFWVLVAVLTPRILKDDIWGDVVIGFSKKNIFPVFLRVVQPLKLSDGK